MLGSLEYMGRSTRFGNIRDKSGTLYLMADIDGFEAFYRDYFEAALTSRGIPISKAVRKVINSQAREKRIELFAALRKEEIPTDLQALFKVGSKKEAEILVRSMTITKRGLSTLIHNAGNLGFKHRIKRKEFVPEHLVVSDGEMNEFTKNPVGPMSKAARKTARKVEGAFDQRRVHICHLFQKRDVWHCLYFSFDDMGNLNDNHWQFGPHVHYVSSLWCKIKPHRLLQLFDVRHLKIPGDFHVKYVEK